ncbi:MAG TPA: YbhB/YbcL family Raf kinase inhibitor-like protein, partial [Blastocatellia bacterium]|nr:YbhB/YbcL family Raf kinase inhibitor-like protein [Blastocatellia bacterium]
MAFGIFATNRPFLSRCGPVAVLIGIAVTQAGCFSRAASQRADSSLELSSTSVSGEIVDGRCTCDGQEKSPELSWSSAPAHTRSFTVIVVDRDSPFSLLFGP